MRIISADPGLRGAFAILDNGKLDMTVAMPVFRVRRKGMYLLGEIRDFILASHADLFVVEAVTRPASLVGNRYFMQGVAMGIGMDVRSVPAQTWKAYFKIGAAKDESRQIAHQHFFDYGFDKMKMKDDGKWEATAIALYAHEVFS